MMIFRFEERVMKLQKPWISVEDRLPTDGQLVFIWPRADFDEVEDYFFSGQYYSSKFKRGNTEHEAGWYVKHSDGWASDMWPIQVTHWMPGIEINTLLFGPPTTGESDDN
jgi:hypothetical protein